MPRHRNKQRCSATTSEGRPLQGEIVLTRLLYRMIFACVTQSERPLGQNLNSVRPTIQNVRGVARLLLARKELEGPEEAQDRVRHHLERMDRELEAKLREQRGGRDGEGARASPGFIKPIPSGCRSGASAG